MKKSRKREAMNTGHPTHLFEGRRIESIKIHKARMVILGIDEASSAILNVETDVKSCGRGRAQQ